MDTDVSMPSKIFGTVWAHGLRGRMLSKNELHTLAESRDIDELVTRMKNTVYLDALLNCPSHILRRRQRARCVSTLSM